MNKIYARALKLYFKNTLNESESADWADRIGIKIGEIVRLRMFKWVVEHMIFKTIKAK